MPMMAAFLLAASMLGQNRDTKPADLVPLLISSDRVERHEAAEALAKLRSVPEFALENIVGYFKAEVTQAMVPDTRPVRDDAEALEKIPVVGDKLSIARIKANPAQHLER
jgi:hypothetical protein